MSDTSQTDQTTAALEAHVASWRRTATRNTTDRPAAERGVVLAYRAAGLPEPPRIVWCRSPMAIEQSRRQNWYTWKPGPALRHRIVDDVIKRVDEAIRAVVPTMVIFRAMQQVTQGTALLRASRAVSEVVRQEVARIRWPMRSWTTGALMALRRSREPFPPFELSAWGQLELREVLGTFRCLSDTLPLAKESAALEGLWQIAVNAGWMVPHERVCWLSDRLLEVVLDERGRLHASKGPAMRFADGWTHHAWKGIKVPAWYIEQSELITQGAIRRAHDPIQRRCMIEIMTPEKFIASGAAHCIGTDHTGRLWRTTWGLDSWSAVEVVNGSPEPDGSFRKFFLQVPNDVRSPTEAVAWTYGMSAERYAALAVRT